MKRSTGTPTKAQADRFRRIREGGCIACRLRGLGYVVPEIHHLTETGRHGGKRRGHDATVGLCAYHHRGAGHLNEVVAGPSLALKPRAFREIFGEDSVLLEVQEVFLKRMEELRGS